MWSDYLCMDSNTEELNSYQQKKSAPSDHLSQQKYFYQNEIELEIEKKTKLNHLFHIMYIVWVVKEVEIQVDEYVHS